MSKSAIALTCLFILSLSACANTAYGVKKDGQQASYALDDAKHRVLKAGAK